MNNPKLRFKADDGNEFPEWEEKTLGELGCFCSGVGFSERYQGHANLPVDVYKVSDMNISGNEREMLRANNTIDESILKKMKTKAIDRPSIIFAKVGAAIFAERKRIARKPFIVDNNMMVFTPNDENDFEYIYWLTLTLCFASRAQIGALPSYNASDISGFVVNIPSLPEQHKIANLLSAVDDVITAQEAEVAAWEKRKKGVMQKLFSQEVRFKADDGSEFPEWTLTVFSDLYQDCREKNVDCRIGLDRMISVATMRFASRDGDTVSQEYLAGCTLLPSNAIAFEGNRSKDYSYGRFVLNDIGDGIMSNRFKCLYPSVGWETTQDLRFWKEYIYNEQVMRKILVRCTKAGTMMNELVILEFLQQSVLVPCLEEQKKIGACLASMDEVIHSLEQELFTWKEFKKGLLQQMFV